MWQVEGAQTPHMPQNQSVSPDGKVPLPLQPAEAVLQGGRCAIALPYDDLFLPCAGCPAALQSHMRALLLLLPLPSMLFAAGLPACLPACLVRVRLRGLIMIASHDSLANARRAKLIWHHDALEYASSMATVCAPAR